MHVRFLSSAELEVFEAFDHYNAIDDDGRTAERFLEEIERTKRSISERPRAWMEIEPGVRHKVLNRFPFALIYEIEGDEIRVFAVAHHSRRPGYWRGRQ